MNSEGIFEAIKQLDLSVFDLYTSDLSTDVKDILMDDLVNKINELNNQIRKYIKED